MIDLHLHTTASDGTGSPAELVAECCAAGMTVIGVADHDTMAAVPDLESAAHAAGLRLVAGIEITSVWGGREIHMLGYFLDYQSPPLVRFLTAQREDRIRRARLIGERLAALGAPIDMEGVIAQAKGRPVLRPAIAAAVVARGHARDVRDAFDRFLADDKPAFIPRAGATPADVVRVVRDAGGASSLAHPGVTNEDRLIPDLVAEGLDAIEAYHADHDEEATARYLALARSLGLAVTGGSDYHGAGSHHAHGFGRVSLPADDFAAFCRRAGR